jgi:hypothetical protein
MKRSGLLLAIHLAGLRAISCVSAYAEETVLATPTPPKQSTEAPANELPSISSSIPALGRSVSCSGAGSFSLPLGPVGIRCYP